MSSAFMHGANAKRGSVHKVLLTPSLICNQTLISNLVAHESVCKAASRAAVNVAEIAK